MAADSLLSIKGPQEAAPNSDPPPPVSAEAASLQTSLRDDLSPQALVPVARRGHQPPQAQQEPLRLPGRLQVFWRHQHEPGFLQA